MKPIYDESTSHELQPNLEDEYLNDLDRLCDRICKAPNDQEAVIAAKIDNVEEKLSESPPKHNQEEMEEYTERLKYLAVLEALLDLVEIGYHVKKDPDNIDGFPPVCLYPPDPERHNGDIQEYKDAEREILQKERRSQFEEDSVRKFIREMETNTRHNGKNINVTDLIVEGVELYYYLNQISNL